MPSYANSDVAQWAATVLRNDWCYQTTVEEQYQGHVFSDASTEAEAFVLLQGEFITQAAQWNRTEENHIFLAETHALCEAFKHHGKNHLYHTDNLPLHWSIQKGHSSSYPANVILRQTFGNYRPTTRWVRTDQNISDPFTRGKTIPSLPFPLQNLVVNDAKGDAGANSSNIHGGTGITWTLRKEEYEG